MVPWEDIYNSLIEKNKNSNLIEGIYYEKHHIIPRYMKGDNSNENLVYLPFKKHILAHYILWRMYKNIEDKIAYKMMSGQTEEGRILKQTLAIKRSNESNKIEKIKELFKDKNKVKEIIKKRKDTRYKNNNGNYYSKDSLSLLSKNMSAKNHKAFSKENIKKRIDSQKQTIDNMSDNEFYNRYVKPMEGPLHPMYGKKRPGELAGNYGKSKGKYILESPTQEIIEFNNLKSLLQYGFPEGMVRKWSNKGTIQKDIKCYRPFKWDGYKLEFIENPNYGDINKQQENRKRFK